MSASNVKHGEILSAQAYMENPEIQAILSDLRGFATTQPDGNLQVSSIKDNAGNQYVDLVMEGGGTLGVSLLGYIYVLEQMNIRFLRIAGTSAGSIVAVLLAAGTIEEEKSPWLIEKVARKSFFDFVDGDNEVQRFVRAALEPKVNKVQVARYTTRILDDLRDHYGLCPGQTFVDWMSDLLAEKAIRNWKDMREKRSDTNQKIWNEITGKIVEPNRWERLSLVTADITTGTKVALPDMAHLYWNNPDEVNPALFSRASMSIPAFFHPMVVKDIPNTADHAAKWNQEAQYRGPIPPQVYFVDGGSISNFPIDLFYKPEGEVDAPVFGIKIGFDRNNYNEFTSFMGFSGAILNSMMSFYDNNFFIQHPELNRYVGEIDYGKHNWLNFSLTEEDKLDLFIRGAKAASVFLKRFKWDYQKDRNFLSRILQFSQT